MTLAELIPLAINVGLFLLVFSLGLRSALADVVFLFRHPGLLVRSILAMNVVMLAFALALVWLFTLPPAIEIALVVLAVSPVPPILFGKQEKAGGSAGYVVGILTATALVSIPLVPLAMLWTGRTFGLDLSFPASAIARIVLISMIAPLAAGVLLRRWLPELARRIERPVSILATILIVAAFLPVLIKTLPEMWGLVGNGLLFALVAFSVAGAAVGHFVGGPIAGDRTVLALSVATRHPAVAMAIAGFNFPDEKLAPVVVLCHLLVASVVCVPYVRWRTREHRHAEVRA